MELRNISADSTDIDVFESINEEAIPENERNSLADLIATGAQVIGIYEDMPAGFMVIRIYKDIVYLAYLAVRRDLRSRGTGSRALAALSGMYEGYQIVVEYEVPADEMSIRRKGFYMRAGFHETGWYTFYDDAEFEIACMGKAYDADMFAEFTVHLSALVSDHIPKPYRKDIT